MKPLFVFQANNDLREVRPKYPHLLSWNEYRGCDPRLCQLSTHGRCGLSEYKIRLMSLLTGIGVNALLQIPKHQRNMLAYRPGHMPYREWNRRKRQILYSYHPLHGAVTMAVQKQKCVQALSYYSKHILQEKAGAAKQSMSFDNALNFHDLYFNPVRRGNEQMPGRVLRTASGHVTGKK